MNLRPHHFILWAVFLIGHYLMPELVSKGTLRTMIFACYLAIFAISWDILSGRTGYISSGHPFLIGIGAYTTAILSKRFDVPVEISIPVAVLVTMVAGLILLLPALRIKGSYFALVTLAFMELICRLVQVIRPDLTGGTRGMSGLHTLPRGAVNGYYLAATLLAVLALAAWLLMRTRVGTALWAIGMNEEAVRGSGLSATRLKCLALLVSAFVAVLGGVFYVHYLGSIAPRALFDINFLFSIIVAVLIGGSGTIVGPIICAFFMVFLLEWLRPAQPGAERYLVFGGIAQSVGFAADDLDRPALELAMGDLRKLEYARTLATGARVLLLDEVFAGLTTGEIAAIADLIQDLREKGFTFLMVSHDLPAIDRGTLLAEGDFAHVLANKEVRASYLGDF